MSGMVFGTFADVSSVTLCSAVRLAQKREFSNISQIVHGTSVSIQKKTTKVLLVKDGFVAMGADHQHGQLGHWRHWSARTRALFFHSPVFLLLDLSKLIPHLTPTRASTPPTQQEHRGPVFILAINLSLPSGLPRATKRARLGLPTLPPPIRKPRLLRVAAARGVTSQKRGWRWWRRTGREEPRMLPQHLRSPATLSEAKNRPHCLQQLTEGTRGTIVGETSFKLGQDSLQSVMHDPEKAEEHWKEVEAFSTNCLNSQFHRTFFAQYQGLPFVFTLGWNL